jgi:pantetheine-phosphate adenylyltransferase
MLIIYPGTFDPFSLGHRDLVIRALRLFSGVLVAVSENLQKSPLFTFEERVHMAKLSLQGIEGVEVVGFDGLLVDLMKEKGTGFVLRGIRGMVDFEFEFQMAQANRFMLPEFEPIFLMPGEKYMALSSTIIREVARHGGDVSKYVTGEVQDYMAKALGGRK